MIGIIAAMDKEISLLESKLQNKTLEQISGMTFIKGTIYGKDVVAVKSGVGKVFAAAAAQTLVLKYNVSCIINTGIGGALNKNLDFGEIVYSSAVVQHDMDTSAVGDPVGMISGINVIKIHADKHLMDIAEKSAKSLKMNSTAGIIASGDKFICSQEDKNRIVSLFEADVCEMEGAAIGHVAYINQIPFIIIRSISDGANSDSGTDYSSFCIMASENSAKLTCEIIKNL